MTKKLKRGRPATGHYASKAFRLTPRDVERIEAIRAKLQERGQPNATAVDAVRYALSKATGESQ